MSEIADVTTLLSKMKGPDGDSPVEQLLRQFEAHEAAEEKSLEEYRRIFSGIGDPVTRFIMQMIISDEEKHRAVIHVMAATLNGALNWTKPAASLDVAGEPVAFNPKLTAVTDEFIEVEKAGIKEFKALIKESASYYQGLFKVLIDAMIHDSEKHIDLLEFLSRRLKAS